MRQVLFTLAIPVALASTGVFLGQSNIDPAHRFAWCENIGWTNWLNVEAPGSSVAVTDMYLSGYLWGENVGWINVGQGPADGTRYVNRVGDDFGVNVDPRNGVLTGFAWGENIGWISFTTSSRGVSLARFDICANRFRGYAWGENVGWINLDDGIRFVSVGPCQAGDLACDGVVALSDYSALRASLAGPGVLVGCIAFDADRDGDIDLKDFADFQGTYTGER